MIVVETTDISLIRDVILTDDLWDKLREDGIKRDDFNPKMLSNRHYLAGYKDNDLVGVQWFTKQNSVSVEYHPMVLKEQRKHAREFIYHGLDWLFTNTPYLKVNVEIPECIMTTINFAKKCGFTQEGIKRDSYLRDGQLYSIYCLGMTKKEFIKWAE